jgi:hypothetical protein
MSWNVSLIGRSAKVVEALETVNSDLGGQSGDEWLAVKPHLSALVSQTFMVDDYLARYPGAYQPLVKLTASGSASREDGKPVQGSCSVSLELIYGALV